MFIHKFEWLPVQLMVRVASFVWAAERTFRNSGRRQITFKRGDLMQAGFQFRTKTNWICPRLNSLRPGMCNILNVLCTFKAKCQPP